jgi:SAM-dependent methyltransferase
MTVTIDRSEAGRLYDPSHLHSEGTARGSVLCTLLKRQGLALCEGRLLDLGCGYGGLSIHAARHGANVVAVDTSDHKVAVLKQRLREEPSPISGSIEVFKGAATMLPLDSATFDRAVTLGVIEWVGLTTAGPDPRALQVRALSEIARVLKPGGTYVLGTKNRWYPVFMLREPQLRWPLVDFLPRRAARLLARRLYGQDYRTYVHSLGGWRSMLHEAGFRTVRALLPAYSYQFPLDLWPINEHGHDLRQSLREAEAWIPPEYLRLVERDHPPHKQSIMQLVLRARLHRLIWPNFLLLAQR